MMIIKIIGYVLIVWGVADFGLSFTDVDLWWTVFGINLQGVVYQFSGMAAVFFIGWLLTKVGSNN